MDIRTIITGLLVAVIALVGLMAYGSSQKENAFGATSCSGITCLAGGLRLVTGAGGQFESDVAAVLGAGLTVTTSNTATSTTILGCTQTYATSTASPIRLLFTASTTATAISGTQAGFVLWGYGTCPF